MTPKEELLKMETMEDFLIFQKKYKGKNISFDSDMIDFLNTLFKKTNPHVFDPKINFEDYHKRKVP